MAEKQSADWIVSRLISTVSSLGSPEERIEALSTFISGHDPGTIGSALGSIINSACMNVESGLAFLSLLNRSSLAKFSPGWNWLGLSDWFSKTILEKAWTIFDRVPEIDKQYAYAKISLLMEIFYILIEDDLLDPETDMNCSGADAVVLALSEKGSNRSEFRIKLSKYPVNIRKFLKEILSELDFIEGSPGNWKFNFSRKTLDEYSSGKNLISHMGSGQMSHAMAQRNAENLVKRLELLMKTLQMFPSGHPSIEPSTDSFTSILSKFLGDENQLTLSIIGDTVMVNDLRVDMKGAGFSGFIRSFSDRKISSITFSSGITGDQVQTFAKVFNRPPVYISEHGGMSRLLELRNIGSISVNRYHYQLISGDDDPDQKLARGEVTLEDAIFSELIDRLEQGESIESLPGKSIGEALKAVLAAAKDDKEEQRGLIARFVIALDPTLLERGLLSNKFVQQGMAWKALRKIIDRLLHNLVSPDPDIRHRAVGKLQEMAVLAVKRGKENSSLQIIENISRMMKREYDPDVLYRTVILIASLMETLLAHGMMSIALTAGNVISDMQGKRFSRTELEAARKRSLAQAYQKLDSFSAAEALVQRLVSDDETLAKEATKLAAIVPPDNLVNQLVNIFYEDDRRLRAKAFRILLKMGDRGLKPIHNKLREIVSSFNTHMDGTAFNLPETDWYKIRNMIQVLRDIGSPESEGILAEMCKIPDIRIKKECLMALIKVSNTTAESLAMHLITDESSEVALIALDVLDKQASVNPAFIPRITSAFRTNSAIRKDIMKSFETLGDKQEVRLFLLKCFKEGESGLLFQDQELVLGALGIFLRHGGNTELNVLRQFLTEVEGGFLKKSKVNKQLVAELRNVVGNLSASEEEEEQNEKKQPRTKVDDDDITIIGSW